MCETALLMSGKSSESIQPEIEKLIITILTLTFHKTLSLVLAVPVMKELPPVVLQDDVVVKQYSTRTCPSLRWLHLSFHSSSHLSFLLPAFRFTVTPPHSDHG